MDFEKHFFTEEMYVPMVSNIITEETDSNADGKSKTNDSRTSVEADALYAVAMQNITSTMNMCAMLYMMAMEKLQKD